MAGYQATLKKNLVLKFVYVKLIEKRVHLYF